MGGDHGPESAATEETATPVLRKGIIRGVGVVGTLDGVVLHKPLQWHTFYVHTTPFWREFIDGLFHLGTAALLVIGALLLYRQRALLARWSGDDALWGGSLLGMGGFTLCDGTIQHKVLQLHPVREGVENILPYDLAFNALALALLATGWWLWHRSGRHPATGASAGDGEAGSAGRRRAA